VIGLTSAWPVAQLGISSIVDALGIHSNIVGLAIQSFIRKNSPHHIAFNHASLNSSLLSLIKLRKISVKTSPFHPNKMALSYLSQPGKQVKLSDGTTYAYLYIPAKPTKSTFLLLHGFPSSSYDWRHQVETLSSKGFGLLIPDLLGYGDTDAPKNIEAYAQKIMAGHMAEILDKEGLTKVVGVAHDWYVSRYPITLTLRKRLILHSLPLHNRISNNC
jgi:hypothetical protein